MRFFFWGLYVKTNDIIGFLREKLVKIGTFFVHIYKFENLTFFDLTLT